MLIESVLSRFAVTNGNLEFDFGLSATAWYWNLKS